MTYRQITSEERYTLMVLRGHGLHVAAIARVLGRHRSTIGRELQRNRGRSDGYYRPPLADWYARSRRSRSRRNQRFSAADWRRIHTLIREDWSPEQVAGRLRLLGELRISHETIYRHIWADLEQGGTLHRHLRCARRKRRKRYGTYERRGRVSGKRPITSRPAAVETRAEVGHWESDTMVGPGRPCVLSLVGAEDRLPGARPAGGAHHRRSESPRHRAVQAQPRPLHTITSDNGTEFHDYVAIEQATSARFYFATPHHAWERGTNENTNGLIRQYIPQRQSMARLTQHDCHAIARKLNRRPRKRLGFRTPEECYVP